MVSAAVLLAGAGCADDGGDDGNGGEATPTTTAPETSTTLSREEQDEEALRQLAEDWDEVNHSIHLGEESVEEAGRFLAGEYLDSYRADVQEFRSQDPVVEADDRTGTAVESVTVDRDEGELVECIVDADIVRDAAGDAIDDGVSATRFRTRAERVQVGWRFVERMTIETFEGELQCEAG